MTGSSGIRTTLDDSALLVELHREGVRAARERRAPSFTGR
jgi:hypothetical protein